MFTRAFRTPLVLFLSLTAVTGIFYPLLITGLAQFLFPRQANGSIILRGTQPIGSELVGQQFSDPRFFWGRPSATEPYPYNALSSSGSNLGPLNPKLRERIAQNIYTLKAADSLNVEPIPVDLTTSSGSGLDPHISVQAALYQVQRVARARKYSEDQVRDMVHRHAEGRQLGILGEPRVNVLRLNLALDQADTIRTSR